MRDLTFIDKAHNFIIESISAWEKIVSTSDPKLKKAEELLKIIENAKITNKEQKPILNPPYLINKYSS